jgi:hypothetical protein
MLLCGLGKGVGTAVMFARRKCEGAFRRQVKEVCLLGRLSATVDVAEPGNKRKTNKTLGNNKVRMFSQNAQQKRRY